MDTLYRAILCPWCEKRANVHVNLGSLIEKDGEVQLHQVLVEEGDKFFSFNKSKVSIKEVGKCSECEQEAEVSKFIRTKEPTKETITILVDSTELKELNEILDIEEGYYPECGECETIRTFTAKFSDGFEADIKVCNGDTPWVDPVLFDPKGCQVQVLDVEDTLEGEYEFDHDGNVYIVDVVENKVA